MINLAKGITSTFECSKLMIQNTDGVSPKNQLLLNGIVRELALSFSKPVLEFVDLLIESFMYPRGNENSLMNTLKSDDSCAIVDDEEQNDSQQYTFETNDLGYGKLLEMIHLRQLIIKSREENGSLPPPDSTQYTSCLLSVLEEVHALMIHILKELSKCIEIAKLPVMYKEVLTENLPNFSHTFHSFKAFNEIMHRLIETVNITGSSDDQVFQINQKTIGLIKRFTEDNKLWFEELMAGSKALKEYLLFEDLNFKPVNDTKQLKDDLPKSVSFAIRSAEFEKYLQLRKSKLRICHRRVF